MRNAVISEIRRHEPGFAPAVIFDVGANIGQSALEFRQFFPGARMYCFEPVAATVEVLCAALGGDPLATVHRLALGGAEGVVRVTARRTSSGNRVVANPRKLEGTEEVPMTTGDAFCAAQGVERIDFLKIDTEGLDLEVLRGFGAMLAEGRVDYVQVECGFSVDNRLHVPFETMLAHLRGLGYAFHGLYGVSRQDHAGGRFTRGLFFGNAVFVRGV